MRWDRLFEDLSARWSEQERSQFAAEVADRWARDVAEIGLERRLLGSEGEVGLQLGDGGWTSGRVLDAGPGWVLLTGSAGLQQLVPLAAVSAVRGLGPGSAPAPGPVAARRTLVLALRALADARLRVLVRTRTAVVRGDVARVGADHVDVRPDEGPQRGGVVLTVPFGALLVVEELPG